MRYQFYLLIIISFLTLSKVYAQNTKKEQVNWIEFQAALKLQEENKKPIMVFLYTNWCKFCKMMEVDVFKNDKAVQYLNTYFNSVRIDAETKDTLIVNNQTYVYKPEYRANELALYLLNGKLSYPTTVFLTSDQKVQRIPSYLDIMHAEWLYKYFGDKIYQELAFEDFMKSHKPIW